MLQEKMVSMATARGYNFLVLLDVDDCCQVWTTPIQYFQRYCQFCDSVESFALAHFQVAACFSFRTSPGAQPFKCIVLHILMQIKLISLTIVEHQDSLRNRDYQELGKGPFLWRHFLNKKLILISLERKKVFQNRKHHSSSYWKVF